MATISKTTVSYTCDACNQPIESSEIFTPYKCCVGYAPVEAVHVVLSVRYEHPYSNEDSHVCNDCVARLLTKWLAKHSGPPKTYVDPPPAFHTGLDN